MVRRSFEIEVASASATGQYGRSEEWGGTRRRRDETGRGSYVTSRALTEWIESADGQQTTERGRADGRTKRGKGKKTKTKVNAKAVV